MADQKNNSVGSVCLWVSLVLLVLLFFLVLGVVKLYGAPPSVIEPTVTPETQSTTPDSATRIPIPTFTTPPPPTSTQSPSPTKPTPTSNPTNTPYDPFLKWSEEPNGEVEIHYDFSKMSEGEVSDYFEVNTKAYIGKNPREIVDGEYDYSIDSNGLHWNVERTNDENKHVELTIWPRKDITNSISNVNINKIIVYYSLKEQEKDSDTEQLYGLGNSEHIFYESNMYFHFSCFGKWNGNNVKFPARVLAGANKWLLSVDYQNDKDNEDQEINNTWTRLETISEKEYKNNWNERFFIALIPFEFDVNYRDPRILGLDLLLRDSDKPITFSIDSESPEKEIITPTTRKWNNFNCLYPHLEYIGFWSELDSGIQATIHDIYILGTTK